MTDKYKELREAISNAEYYDDIYWLDRYRGESEPETICVLLAERDELREALQALYDYQNGPPLERYRDSWEKAMAAASKLLSHNDGTNETTG